MAVPKLVPPTAGFINTGKLRNQVGDGMVKSEVISTHSVAKGRSRSQNASPRLKAGHDEQQMVVMRHAHQLL